MVPKHIHSPQFGLDRSVIDSNVQPLFVGAGSKPSSELARISLPNSKPGKMGEQDPIWLTEADVNTRHLVHRATTRKSGIRK